MNDIKNNIKAEFKQWLHKNFSKSTAYSYYALVQKIFDKNFGISQDWQRYSNDIIPLLARYFEFANREYYLDRMTIWYALDYFDKILKFIYPNQNKPYKNEPDVKISLYDGKNDYPVADTSFYDINSYIKFLANHIFKQSHKLNTESINTLKTLVLIPNISEKIKPIDIKDVAIHIDYKESSYSAKKNALSQYCNFLYSMTANSAFDYKSNPIVKLATTNNPNNMIGGNYHISQPITGKQPLQIIFENNTCREYLHDDIDDEKDDNSKEYIPDFSLIISDLVDILHIDRKSIVKHFVDKEVIKNMRPNAEKIEKIYGIAKDKTVLRSYFSLSSTNKFLKEHHHSVYKNGFPVNYDNEGYDYWILQSEAIRELDISRNAFGDLITKNNCSYIDYIKGYPRYYDEDIQYLKTTRLIIEAQRRKILYLRKNKKIKIN